jgi:hypothetical protein
MPEKPDFQQELQRLQRNLPPWACRMLRDVDKPHAVWVRVPAAIGLTVGGLFGFLPVVGFWMTPFGLALLAVDLPFMRRPLAPMLAFINRKLPAGAD